MSKKGAFALAAVAVVIVAGTLGWRSLHGREGKVTYRTETVERGDVKLLASATGTLKAVVTVQVGSQISGTVSALYADFNDEVREGDVLAQLDPAFLRAQVAQSEAELTRADVEFRKAVRDSTRFFSLEAEDLVSRADLDAAQTALDAARASVASAKAALDRVRTNLRYATISSPIDGVIVSRDVDVGQTVAASLSAPTLFTIAKDLTRMQLEASVDEADIGQIREGQTATFTVDAYPSKRFSGTVHQIRLAPQTVQNVVTYTVVILVENLEKILLPGMTANVSILVDEANGVLKVPAAALRFKLQGTGASPGAPRGEAGRGPGRPDAGLRPSGEQAEVEQRGTVYVLDRPGDPSPVLVRTGPSDGSFTAVYSDSLAEGTNVVIGSETSGKESQQVVNPFMPNRGRARGR